MKSKGIRIRILVPLTIVFIAIFTSFMFIVYIHEKHQLTNKIVRDMELAQDIIKEEIESNTEMLRVSLEFITRDEQLRTALIEKNRKMLLKRAKPIFEQLNFEYGISHFYFSGPDRVNILRVHKPEHYGDKINRFTTMEAEKTGKPFQGIELGPLGTFTLRVVVPWFDKGQLIGYVELGHEMGHVIQKVHETLNDELFLAIDKQFLDRESWEIGMKMLGHKSDWDQLPSSVIVSQTIKTIPGNIIKSLSQKDFQYEKIHLEELSEGIRYYSGFFPLIDAGGRKVGKMVILKDNTNRIKNVHKSLALTGLICFIMGGVLYVFFYIFTGRVEDKIETSNKELQKTYDELKERATEIEIAKTMAEVSNRTKNEFLANMTHELRTPLNAIIGFSKMMHDGMTGPLNDKQKKFSEDIYESGNRLLLMIQDILDLSNIDANMMELNYTEIDARNMIKHSILLFKEKIIEHHLKLNTVIEDNIGTIKADEKRLKQVLKNLLSNAVKFTPDGGSITVKAKKVEGDNIEISIKDTGIGISEENQKKLFQPFQQIEDPYIKKYQGAGVGLFICKKIVEMHRGSIRAESEAGKGTTFTIKLPVYI